MIPSVDATRSPPGFRHEALLYAGEDELVARLTTLVRHGLDRDDRVLVVVARPKLDRLRAELGADAAAVSFADMSRVGTNPARIIPLWHAFVERHAGSPVLGVGEPVDAHRAAEALVECQLHERLLNVAFDPAAAFRLVCPYDTASLPPEVIAEALRSHPHVAGACDSRDAFQGIEACVSPFDAPLAPPPADALELSLDGGSLRPLRDRVASYARSAGLSRRQVADLVLTVHELAANTLRHGGGTGTAAVWSDGGSVVVEVRDAGRFRDPLVGRIAPGHDAVDGRGLWMANQLCDLVQIRSGKDGSVVRARLRRR